MGEHLVQITEIFKSIFKSVYSFGTNRGKVPQFHYYPLRLCICIKIFEGPGSVYLKELKTEKTFTVLLEITSCFSLIVKKNQQN